MKIGTSRVETFSDGVIAIIITIMVLDLRIPDITRLSADKDIMNALLKLLPFFIAYILSFLMGGILWINHHHLFHLLGKTNEPLLAQNLFFLFWMSLIPVTTKLLGANPFIPVSCAFYGFVMLMCALSFSIMHSYTRKKELIHKDSNKVLTKKIQILFLKAQNKSYVSTVAYLISIPLAFVNVYFSYFCFIIPPLIFFIPDGIDDEKFAEKIAEKNS